MAGEYRTRQRERITRLLTENRDSHLSAEEIETLLSQEECAVSRATIYRCLDRLVEQGEVRRYVSGDGKSACYQLAHTDCRRHYHFKCTACGALLHVECAQLDGLEKHIRAQHGFEVDSSRTVFYGLCKKCSGGNET